jgi:hypothetical protein
METENIKGNGERIETATISAEKSPDESPVASDDGSQYFDPELKEVVDQLALLKASAMQLSTLNATFKDKRHAFQEITHASDCLKITEQIVQRIHHEVQLHENNAGGGGGGGGGGG